MINLCPWYSSHTFGEVPFCNVAKLCAFTTTNENLVAQGSSDEEVIMVRSIVIEGNIAIEFCRATDRLNYKSGLEDLLAKIDLITAHMTDDDRGKMHCQVTLEVRTNHLPPNEGYSRKVPRRLLDKALEILDKFS